MISVLLVTLLPYWSSTTTSPGITGLSTVAAGALANSNALLKATGYDPASEMVNVVSTVLALTGAAPVVLNISNTSVFLASFLARLASLSLYNSLQLIAPCVTASPAPLSTISEESFIL